MRVLSSADTDKLRAGYTEPAYLVELHLEKHTYLLVNVDLVAMSADVVERIDRIRYLSTRGDVTLTSEGWDDTLLSWNDAALPWDGTTGPTGSRDYLSGVRIDAARDWESVEITIPFVLEEQPGGSFGIEAFSYRENEHYLRRGEWRGNRCRIMQVLPSDELLELFDGQLIGAEIGDYAVALTAGRWALQSVQTPRRIARAPTFRHLPPPGSLHAWDGVVYELRGAE